jgi:hypothetical protein
MFAKLIPRFNWIMRITHSSKRLYRQKPICGEIIMLLVYNLANKLI